MSLCLSLLFSVKPENVQFTTNVSANKACLNDVVFFNCSAADANPPAMYHFFENDVLFGSSRSGEFSKVVMNSGNLTYKCAANNTAGTTSSQNVSITVNGKSNHRASRIMHFFPANYALFFGELCARNPELCVNYANCTIFLSGNF